MTSRLVLLLLVLALSCMNNIDASVTGVVGTYTLIRVDDAALPFATGTGRIVRGFVELRSDGHYTISQTDSASSGALSAFTSNGLWTITDNAVSFREGNTLLLGIAMLDTLRMNLNSHANVYVRH